MSQYSYSYDLDGMTHTWYKLQYDSLPRDGWVYYAEGFTMFSYYLFYSSGQKSSLDRELDSNKN